MTRSNSTQSAFTLVELLVALGIASLMLVLITQLFNATNLAIQTGVKTGDMLTKSETIGNQLRRDADDMVSPGIPDNTTGKVSDEVGFLVIGQKLITNGGNGVPVNHRAGVPYPDTVAPDATSGKTNDNPKNRIRSDQLSFIITNRGSARTLTSVTPEKPGRLSTDVQAPFARVWYGHLRKTNPDATIPPNNALGEDGGANKYASQWALGRQALLLVKDAGAGSLNLDPAGDTYVPQARWNSPVQNTNAPTGMVGAKTYPSPNNLLRGVTDVVYQVLSSTAAGKTKAGVIEHIENGGAYPVVVYDFSLPQPHLPYVNPAPGGSQSKPVAADNQFKAWRLAQTHMLLAGNVSDFIVEFAGDYQTQDNTGAVTNTTQPDGQIDTTKKKAAYDIPKGDIKWYGDYYNNPTNGSNRPGANGNFDATRPVVFKTPAGLTSGGATDPAHNIAYDDNSKPFDTADAVFTFRHDDGKDYNSTDNTNSKWPYLLRIRYRVHDNRGRIQSTGTNGRRVYGQWFEHIIKVRRPGVK